MSEEIPKGDYVFTKQNVVASIEYNPKGKSTMVIAEEKDGKLIILDFKQTKEASSSE